MDKPMKKFARLIGIVGILAIAGNFISLYAKTAPGYVVLLELAVSETGVVEDVKVLSSDASVGARTV